MPSQDVCRQQFRAAAREHNAAETDATLFAVFQLHFEGIFAGTDALVDASDDDADLRYKSWGIADHDHSTNSSGRWAERGRSVGVIARLGKIESRDGRANVRC
mgnify:CR=1 FL=1